LRKIIKTTEHRSVERGVPGSTSNTGPGFFRGAQNFGNSLRYVYTKMKKFKK